MVFAEGSLLQLAHVTTSPSLPYPRITAQLRLLNDAITAPCRGSIAVRQYLQAWIRLMPCTHERIGRVAPAHEANCWAVFCYEPRLVLKCGLAHLNANANARDESNANANALHLNQMHLQMQMRSSRIKCKCKCI